MSKLETNTVDSISGTSTLTLGGSNASVVSAGTEVRSNKLSPASGTALQIGDSGDTITIPSGATIVNSGTQTGFGGTNTPAFRAYLNGTQSISATTGTKITFNGEALDTNNCFDSSTNYRFTPTVAGNYVIGLHSGGASLTGTCAVYIRKNGSTNFYVWDAQKTSTYREGGWRIVNFNGSSDYIEGYVYFGSARDISGQSGNNYNTWFEGYKIIE